MAPHKITLSTVFAGQKVGVKQVADNVWLVTFMNYDLGSFDEETARLEPIANPFEAKVLPSVRNRTLPMCPECTRDVADYLERGRLRGFLDPVRTTA